MGTPTLRVADILAKHGKDSFKEEEFSHYGVPGMRWGVRRPRSARAAAAKKSDDKGDSVTVKVAKRGGRIQKVDVDTDGSGKTTPSVVNVKTKRVTPRNDDATEKERIEARLKEFGTDAVSSSQLRTYAARVELEGKINKLNPPAQNPAKAFVKDLIAKDREKIISSGDFKQTSSYMMYSAGKIAIELAKQKAKKG